MKHWHVGRPRPWPHCVRWGPSYPPPQGARPPIFGPCFLWKMGEWIKMLLAREVGLGPEDTVLHGSHRPPERGGHSSLLFSSHVYCGQTARWIKMSLVAEVGLVPVHIVSGEDAAPSPQKGTVPNFQPMSILWVNGWMDQDATWYEGRPRPRPLCVRWGLSPQIFGPYLLWPNGRPP